MKTFEAENAWFTFKVDNPDLFEENWRNWDNYKSPISVIVPDVLTQLEVNIEKSVVSAISDLGVSVDKDELVRALQYDREQYEKGYHDGRRFVMDGIVRCKDCKHYGYDPYDNGDKCCVFWGEWIFPNDDDFCSRGERKAK